MTDRPRRTSSTELAAIDGGRAALDEYQRGAREIVLAVLRDTRAAGHIDAPDAVLETLAGRLALRLRRDHATLLLATREAGRGEGVAIGFLEAQGRGPLGTDR